MPPYHRRSPTHPTHPQRFPQYPHTQRTAFTPDTPNQSIPGKGDDEYRLFTHFYTFIGLSDPVAARHHRRLVRDLVHFRESLFCAAATIVGRLRTAGGGDRGRLVLSV